MHNQKCLEEISETSAEGSGALPPPKIRAPMQRPTPNKTNPATAKIAIKKAIKSTINAIRTVITNIFYEMNLNMRLPYLEQRN